MSDFPKQVSLHGKRAYVTPDSEVVAKAFVAGGDGDVGSVAGSIVFPSPHRAAYYTDFLGDAIPDELNVVTGDTGSTGSAIQAFTGGVYRLQLSATVDASPSGVLALNMGSLQFDPDGAAGTDKGQLRLRTRIKLPSLTIGSVFVGFTDATAAEMPAYDTGAGVLTPATDCFGFIYGENGDTGWHLVASQNGTDQEAVASFGGSVVSPTANVYQVLECLYERDAGDTGGSAYFYIDGKLVGSISNPIQMVGMTPQVSIFEVNSTGAGAVDLDDWNPSVLRDTGQ